MPAQGSTPVGSSQRATVRLLDATPETGGLTAELVALDDAAMARGPTGRGGKAPRLKLGQAKAKAAKDRKVARRRK